MANSALEDAYAEAIAASVKAPKPEQAKVLRAQLAELQAAIGKKDSHSTGDKAGRVQSPPSPKPIDTKDALSAGWENTHLCV
jgi:hypothetical protein